MNELEKLADSIVNICNDNLRTTTEKKCVIESSVKHFVDDVLKLKKNIDETSFSSRDHTQRCIELERTFGISKTHLIK